MKCKTCGAESNDSAFITCHVAGCPYAPKLADLRAAVDRMTATQADAVNRRRQMLAESVIAAAVGYIAVDDEGPCYGPVCLAFDELKKAVRAYRSEGGFECPRDACLHVDYCGRRNGCQWREDNSESES